jgi:hypothetical protein
MPWDRENKEHVLQDSRAYDVGLSDDAGGGNPLGFATKVAFAPNQLEVSRVDDYIKYTLYGVKPDTAKPPLKSLQIRPEDLEQGTGHDLDGIRMTMFYYNQTISNSTSGHWNFNYTEASKCHTPGIQGGPNWCMTEALANATYRAFNFPHHTASYFAMYRAARNHNFRTHKSWDWYLMRAVNTTLKFGSPEVGVMDGTVFREILQSVKDEAAADPRNNTWRDAAQRIENNMLTRAKAFAEKEYPYGSEFAFDTTGQEEVVLWLLHFAKNDSSFVRAANRTVNHILSYMRSSATFAYHGGTRSWGDLGNNGKWMVSSGTTANFETRGNFHYRSGLNSIPLLEWYRAYPDDGVLLMEIALGAQAGTLTSINEDGAPSMMLHMLPHVLDFDPHSGDYGLGFFGHTIQAGAYFVNDKILGPMCYLCDFINGRPKSANLADEAILLAPRDSFRQRMFIEPLALYLTLDTGLFEKFAVDIRGKTITIWFATSENEGEHTTFDTRRLHVEKTSDSRPGKNFRPLSSKPIASVRGAFVLPQDVYQMHLTWDDDDTSFDNRHESRKITTEIFV